MTTYYSHLPIIFTIIMLIIILLFVFVGIKYIPKWFNIKFDSEKSRR